MLTSDQSILTYDRGAVLPDRLSRRAHAHYIDYAQRMLTLYHAGAGRTRRELHKAVESILADEPACSSRRVAAFCKLLDDAGAAPGPARGGGPPAVSCTRRGSRSLPTSPPAPAGASRPSASCWMTRGNLTAIRAGRRRSCDSRFSPPRRSITRW